MHFKGINIRGIKTDELTNGVNAKVLLRHLPIITLGIFFALGYISVRFDCITAMETVSHLKYRLETVRTETQRERALYMSGTCESAMQKMVDTLHLGLRIQERPPYRLEIPEE